MSPSFKIVADDLREPDEDPRLLEALLAGKTVFLPEWANSKVSTLYSRVRQRHGKVLRRRSREVDGISGFVVWLEEPAEWPELELEGGDQSANASD